MKVDRRNLQIQLVRGRTQTMVLRFGNWTPTPPPPAGQTTWSWTPINISALSFSFTMRSNFTLKQPTIAITYNPIVNLADPTQGQLMWNILGNDIEPLEIGNYVFDMAVVGSDGLSRFFCGGTAPLYDNVTDIVNLIR